MFKNILVPYDGLVFANNVFSKSLEITIQHNSNLKVVACLDIANIGGWYIDKRTNKGIMKNAKKLTTQLFSKLESIAREKSILLDMKII